MLRELGVEGVIDCHTHSGGTDAYNYFAGNLPHSQSVADLMLKADLAGVDRTITFPFPGSSYFNAKKLVEEGKREPSGLQSFPYEVENRVLVNDCSRHEGKVLPFACIDPTTKVEEQIDSLANLSADGKIFGLKLHTLAAGCNAQALIKSGFANFTETNNLPILIHSGMDALSNPQNILSVGKQFRNLRLCIAHLATLDSTVINVVRKMENVFVDCAPFLQLCKAVKDKSNVVNYPNQIDPANPGISLYRYYRLLKDHLVWGTDEPWTTSIESDGTIRSNHTYFDEIKVLKDLFDISEQALIAITSWNTKRFLFG